jgi:membrane protein YdbS with pleckstrin-like domain
LNAADSSQREENRRALLRLYSLYTIQYAAFAFVLAVAVVGELILLGSPAFPQFVVYPLILITAIPAIMSFYFMIHWWRIQNYTLSLQPDGVQGDSLAALHGAYQNYEEERSPRFVVEGMLKMDGRRVALVLLVVFLLSLPLSYYAVSSPGLAVLSLVAAVSFVAGALVVLLIPPLTSRREVRRAVTGTADHEMESLSKESLSKESLSKESKSWSMADKVLDALSSQAERLRLTANEKTQLQSADRSQSRARVDLGDLPDRIVAEINSLAASKNSLVSDQRESLTRVVSSLASTTIALGLPAEAARIYSAYRTIIPE